MTLALAAVTLALAAVMLTLAVAILPVAISRIALDRAANPHPLVEEAPVAAPCPTPRAEGTESGMLPGTCLLPLCLAAAGIVPRLLARGATVAAIGLAAATPL